MAHLRLPKNIYILGAIHQLSSKKLAIFYSVGVSISSWKECGCSSTMELKLDHHITSEGIRGSYLYLTWVVAEGYRHADRKALRFNSSLFEIETVFLDVC